MRCISEKIKLNKASLLLCDNTNHELFCEILRESESNCGELLMWTYLSGNIFTSIGLYSFDGKCRDESSHQPSLAIFFILTKSHNKTKKVLESESSFLV